MAFLCNQKFIVSNETKALAVHISLPSSLPRRLIANISQGGRNDMGQKMYRINEQLNLIYTQKEERSLRSREIQESFSVLYYRVV